MCAQRCSLYLVVSILFMIRAIVSAQQITTLQEERFVRHLIEKSDSLIYDIDQTDERLSQRLGIQYKGVKNKFLISYELNPFILHSLGEKSCQIQRDSLEDSFSRLTFVSNDRSLSQQYYFRQGKFVAPFTYFTRRWKKIITKNFACIISDSSIFNEYSAQELEHFTEAMMDTLDFSFHEREVLNKEKIYYVLCRDESEIEQVTGYKSRGMYNLAYDMVVTTYNCHYHELLHLLMNYKLKTLPLYTIPVLQEGFAVAFGGRGGYEPEVLLHTGAYLQSSGFAEVHDLLSRQGFAQTDASISYPVSGLFVGHLFRLLGVQNFCELYRQYSGTDAQVDTMTLRAATSSRAWDDYIQEYVSSPMISIVTDARSFPIQTSGMQHDSAHWYVCFKDTLLIQSNEFASIHHSKKFAELFPSRTYHGEHYACIASTAELSVYDLYTGNLIANYVQSFSLSPAPIIGADGYTRCILFKKDLK
jgi:hypothetical protein